MAHITEHFVQGSDNKASSRGIGSFRESESLPRNVPGNYQKNGATSPHHSKRLLNYMKNIHAEVIVYNYNSMH